MNVPRPRIALLAAVALALGMAAVPAVSAAAKKKGAKSKVFQASVAPNAAVPEDPGAARSTSLTSTITVGKKFKGRVVGDVNVTGIQTTGSATGAANDLIGYLVAPGGRTLQLFFFVGDQSLGPWTLDDDTSVSICGTAPPAPCANPDQSLSRPFAGTSNLLYNWATAFPTNATLSLFNGLPMRGTWTLMLGDVGPDGVGNGTSVLNGWGLRIAPAKPPK